MDEKEKITDEKKMFGFRIGYFAKRSYGSLTAFAKYIDIAPQQLNAYVHGIRTAHADIQLKFYSAGMSVDWLLSGSGNMFARNARGEQLREEFSKHHFPESEMNYHSNGFKNEELSNFVENTVFKTINDMISTGKLHVKLNLPMEAAI